MSAASTPPTSVPPSPGPDSDEILSSKAANNRPQASSNPSNRSSTTSSPILIAKQPAPLLPSAIPEILVLPENDHSLDFDTERDPEHDPASQGPTVSRIPSPSSASSRSNREAPEASTELTSSPNPFGQISSDAAREWNRRKQQFNEENGVIDKLMGYVGLEEVKRQFLDIKSKVDICQQQGRNLNKERFNVVFQGNPGTGKTTIARLYAKFLHSMGLVGSPVLKEKSGTKLCTKGSLGVKRMFKKMLKRHGGGVLFVDEAYQLTAAYTDGLGRQVLDVILTTMENEIGKIAVIFVGYKDEMESLYEHNPGLTSRIPYMINFADFTHRELWQILHDNIKSEYQGRMKVEGGMDGLYARVAIRRLAQSRKNRGFGNARAVENLLAKMTSRQARRLAEEKRQGRAPDPLLLTKEDLIGPEPDMAVAKSQAWIDLHKLIGLESVKKCVQSMLGMTQLNYQRELAEVKPFRFSLNQVFVGAPGTGKTTVAQLYGKMLADIGLLSKGDVVLKNPADFIGECLGKSEAKTRKILDATVGRVLVIDEAYMLDSGDESKGQDKFRAGVIDTLVAMVQGVPGEDRCIILVGYEDKISNMFQNVNPGLSRRFPISRPFRFENFSLPQLMEIMEKKMDEKDLKATSTAMAAAKDLLERALLRPNFSNAGEVNSVLETAQMNFEMRQARASSERHYHDVLAMLEPEDFDKDYARGTAMGKDNMDIRKALKGLVHDTIIERLASYQTRSLGARKAGLKPRDQVPTNFVFKGFTGTHAPFNSRLQKRTSR